MTEKPLSELHAGTVPMSLVCKPGFEPVGEAFARNFAEGLELGAGFCAIRDGEVLVDCVGGHADRNQTRPMTRDTLMPVYSTTKPIAALVVALLVEQGLLDYDAPVASVWPEFAAHGKARVTLAQALSHQAGVPGFVNPIDPDLWLDHKGLCAALADLEPLWEPGTSSGYHALTVGFIAGEVVRRAGARSLGSVLREDVTAPLGIDFWIGTPASEHARCAEALKPRAAAPLGEVTPEARAAFLKPWSSPTRGGAAWREAEIPSANGHGTAASVAMLYQALALRGRIGETRLISPAVWDQMAQRRIFGRDRVLPFKLDWAAGAIRNVHRVFGPNPETLFHTGWGGSCGLADPEFGVSAGYVMNRQEAVLLGDPRSGRLIEALYACLGTA